jgi:hypothetical protein
LPVITDRAATPSLAVGGFNQSASTPLVTDRHAVGHVLARARSNANAAAISADFERDLGDARAELRLHA